jgi:alkaline phosphatase D
MTTSLTRRRFLTTTGAGAGALLLARPPLGRASGVPPAGVVAFPQGVACGQPATDAITLWTRVAGIHRDSRLTLEVARDPGFARVLHRQEVVARAETGFAVHQRVRSRALRPGEPYWYRFATRRTNGPVGRFRTALPASSRDPVRIGFFSCQDYESGYYTAHAALAQEADLDLVVCLGDYVYERSFDDAPVRRDTTGANGDGEVQTLGEYRDKYALYHTDANLQALRAAHPLMAIWDDHEVEDNYAAGRAGDATLNPRVPFLQRRANGYRAFFEHMPRIRVAGEADRIYGSLPLGANAELLLLDQRQYRDDQPCGDQFGVPCAESDDPGRTMLGAAQKAWFLDALGRSRATWKVVANQLMMMALDVPAGNPLNPDQWDGYVAERREILLSIQRRGIRDVSFVTGDIHTFFAGRVTPDGRQLPGGLLPQPVATEFVGGSITSKGIADTLAGENGRDAVAIPGDAAVLANNPHMVYSNQSTKGYAVVEARPGELRVDYRGVRTTQQQASTPFTLASFRVPRGAAQVQRTA